MNTVLQYIRWSVYAQKSAIWRGLAFPTKSGIFPNRGFWRRTLVYKLRLGQRRRALGWLIESKDFFFEKKKQKTFDP